MFVLSTGNHSSRIIVTNDLQRSQPECLSGQLIFTEMKTHSYSILLQMGFTMRSMSPLTRCALTAPFHAYPDIPGAIFSVALSLGSPPLDVIQHPVLWSPDFPPNPVWIRRLPPPLGTAHYRQPMDNTQTLL